MRVLSSLAAAVIFSLLAGCDVQSLRCLASVEPAIIVDVRSGATGPLDADGVTGVLIAGSYRDTMRIVNGSRPLILEGGYERSGTYTVGVRKPGFEPWVKPMVYVAQGECGPVTERLTAELEPDSSGAGR